MEFIIGGQTIKLESLDSCIDEHFVRLHAAYFGREAITWETFEDASCDLFDKYPEQWKNPLNFEYSSLGRRITLRIYEWGARVFTGNY